MNHPQPQEAPVPRTATGVVYTYAEVDHRLSYAALPTDPVQRAVFLVNRGDRAWNPASTTHEIYGPARVEYTRYPDGGITVTVKDL